MERKIKNNILVNLILIRKNDFIKWTIYLCYILAMFVIYSNSSIIDINCQKDFYSTQLSLFNLLFGVMGVVIIGSFLGSKDLEYKTYSMRVVNSDRCSLIFSKLVTLFAVSVIMEISFFIIGLIFDLISNKGITIYHNILLKIIFIVIMNYFWAILALMIAFLTKSFGIGNIVVIMYIFGEKMFAQYIPLQILKLLPMWNEKNIANHLFVHKEGLLAINQQSYGNISESVFVLFMYMIFSIGLYIYIYLRRELK